MNKKSAVLIIICVLAVVALYAFSGPIPQPGDYHQFADQRTFWGIPNAMNVLSNLGFLAVGAWGLQVVMSPEGRGVTGLVWGSYLVLMSGVFLTAFGSAWYHFDPNNQTLVWDRLPMTLMFMGFMAVVLGESLHGELGRRWLPVLVIFGLASVLYWAWTESRQQGDLRPYLIVQFLPMLLVPAMLLLYEPPKAFRNAVWWLLGWVLLAKICEFLDVRIFEKLGVVSGHTLKHVFAAAGLAFIPAMLRKRIEP